MKRFLSVLLCVLLLLGLLPAVSPPAQMISDYTLKVSPTAAFVGDMIRTEVTGIVGGTGPFGYAFVLYRDTPIGWEYAAGSMDYHPANIKYLTPSQPGIYKVYSVVWDDATLSSFYIWSGDTTTVVLRPSIKITTVESLSGTSLKITWNKVPGASGYFVERSTIKTTGFELVKATTATSFTNTGLKAGTQYFYRVLSYNLIDGVKWPSSKKSGIAAGVPLAKSAIVSATGISTTQIKLTWNEVTGATGYQILRSATPGGVYTSIKLTTALTYTAGSLQHGKTYYFKVRPYKRVYTTNYYGPLSGYKAGKTK